MISYPLHNILFLDIETVPQYPDYEAVPENWKALWDLKSNSLLKHYDGETNASLYPRAGIYAEFGKIVAIGVGFFHWNDDQEICLKVKSISKDRKSVV